MANDFDDLEIDFQTWRPFLLDSKNFPDYMNRKFLHELQFHSLDYLIWLPRLFCDII